MTAAPPPPPEQAPVPQQVPAQERMNTLAIVAFVSAFIVAIVAIVLGHISLGQIKRTGERGRGLALAATILGYVFTFIQILALIFFVWAGTFLASQDQTIDELIEEMEQGQQSPTPESNAWDGTDVEEFCDALYGRDAVTRDAAEKYQFLSDTAPNADLASKYERLAEIHGGEVEYSEEIDAENLGLLEEVEGSSADICMDAS